jgi:hypothetical protein
MNSGMWSFRGRRGGTATAARALATAVLAALAATGPVPAAPAGAGSEGAPARAGIDKVLADYIGLYAAETLPRWKTLFHPALSVAFPGDDGGIVVRDLEGFYERQRNYFATGRRISERLENVRVGEGRRIARVTADFVFVDEGAERRGRLGLHLVQGADDAWKIVAIVFSYDER